MTPFYEEEVIEFIHRRFPVDNNWCTGNCYWFAFILQARFIDLDIYYLPIMNHYIAGDGKIFFDWNGKHTAEDFDETPELWEDMLFNCNDQLYLERSIDNCIL